MAVYRSTTFKHPCLCRLAFEMGFEHDAVDHFVPTHQIYSASPTHHSVESIPKRVSAGDWQTTVTLAGIRKRSVHEALHSDDAKQTSELDTACCD